jgi:hypothetical protein
LQSWTWEMQIEILSAPLFSWCPLWYPCYRLQNILTCSHRHGEYSKKIYLLQCAWYPWLVSILATLSKISSLVVMNWANACRQVTCFSVHCTGIHDWHPCYTLQNIPTCRHEQSHKMLVDNKIISISSLYYSIFYLLVLKWFFFYKNYIFVYIFFFFTPGSGSVSRTLIQILDLIFLHI